MDGGEGGSGKRGCKIESADSVEKEKNERESCWNVLAGWEDVRGISGMRLVILHDLHWKIPYVELENGRETNTTISAERLRMDQGKESLQ